ncbi:MAG: hypothetical protein ACREIL_07160 [Nitrospiraceae bacterium]
MATWGAATFHVVLLITSVALGLYGLGALGDTLSTLDTGSGLALFLVLWCTTWWSTRRATAGISMGNLEGQELLRIVLRGPLWGGLNGVLFFLALAVPVLIYLFISKLTPAAGMSDSIPALLSGAITLLVAGSFLAFIIGSVTGLFFVVIDLAFLRVLAVLLKVINS